MREGGSGGREGALRKGTSEEVTELCMAGGREREEGGRRVQRIEGEVQGGALEEGR